MSPVKFLFTFLFVALALWLFLLLVSKLAALFLSRVLKASVGFRLCGFRRLKDVRIDFQRGGVESVSVGEIKLCLQQSLVQLVGGGDFISKDPKLQLRISNLEVVTRVSAKSSKKTTPRKPKKSSGSKPGKGKVMAVANMARFLSLSIRDLVVKTPKATVEIKELGVDMSKDQGSKPSMYLKLQILPIAIHLGEPHVTAGDASTIDKSSAHFVCEEFGLLFEFASHREMGVSAKNVDISLGEISVDLNEDLISKKKKPSDTHVDEPPVQPPATESDIIAKKEQKKQATLAAITKNAPFFPEKFSLTLPKLDVKFVHKEHCVVMENNITAVQFKIIKSRSFEDESTRIDLQLDFSEIHILKEGGSSVINLHKLAVLSFVYIPLQPTSPIKSEIDIKLGGTHCNIIMARLKPLMKLRPPKKNKTPQKEESGRPVKVQSGDDEFKVLVWTFTFSAPETTIALVNMDGLLLYHGCLEASHVFANNTSNTGGTLVHLELGDLSWQMADEFQESLKSSFFVVETNTDAVLHVSKIILEFGKKEVDSVQQVAVLSVDVIGIGMCLTFTRVQSLLSTALWFKTFLKKPPQSAPPPPVKSEAVKSSSSSSSGKGIQLVKFNLQRCSVNLCGDVTLDNEIVEDPKRVNYGSQGGRVLITELPDGTLRTAKVASATEYKTVTCSVGLEIIQLSLSLNKEKQSTQVELERVTSAYREITTKDGEDTCSLNVALFDMQKAKFVKRAGGGHKEVSSICSLFSATTITARWEPDVHLALVELGLRLKLLMHNHKLQEQEQEQEITKDRERPSVVEKSQKKKKESLFAIDVEMLTVTAEAGDGVETMIQVQSIFSENARIGVLLEGLLFSFNSVRVFKSGRMQLSRIPNGSVKWDYVIQGLDMHICLPFRLQLRAIDDSVEEMIRALKLVAAAKKKILFPFKKESEKSTGANTNAKKPSSSKLGRVKLYVRKLTVEIEEEPLQGWLDEHYHLRKKDAHEMAVRLSFLDNLSKGSESPESVDEEKMQTDGGQDKTSRVTYDASTIEKQKEELYKKSFRSYYEACQNLVISEGTGACHEGFESGFKFSASRTSLFSIIGTALDVTLTAIEGGEAGMIELVQKLDPVARECNVPFARVYGSNLNLQAGSLVVQLRDYSYPLFAATSGKCEGRLVLAQQATPFQPQTLHEVYIGKWRKVEMYRSVSGTTPPMKTFLDLPLHFEKGEVSFGVGFEPPLADLSYAFTVALRRAKLSVRDPNPFIIPPKKEKSLPWWDEMRNYIHGNTTLSFSQTLFNILATTDPYEKSDKFQMSSGYMEIQQSDGRINASAKDLKIFTSSLENLLRNSTTKPPAGEPCAFVVAPSIFLEVAMDWGCDSGTPLNHFLFALPSEGVAREYIYDPFRSTSLSMRVNMALRPCTINVAPHDIVWLIKFINLNYLPPVKLRFFSRYPRFGVPRVARSGNLSLDKVMTEFMLRVDSTPTIIRHISLDESDPAKGLTFKMSKLKSEMYLGRGKQKFTFDSPRDLLVPVYQGIDLHMPKVFLNKDDTTCVIKVQTSKKASQDGEICSSNATGTTDRHRDDGFILSSDYFIVRKQSPKADCSRLLAWREACQKSIEMKYVAAGDDNDEDARERSDPSDDDGYNVVVADNCQRIFVYGLKLLLTIENKNGILSWGGELGKAVAPPKPSPSRQYAQRKLLEETQDQPIQEDVSKTTPTGQAGSPKEASKSDQSPSNPNKVEHQTFEDMAKHVNVDGSEEDEEGTCNFMVNVIEPQFNLHSDEANGRFLLAAASGRVLSREFHKVVNVGIEVIEQAVSNEGDIKQPELIWNRSEVSVMLEHVQAHVAPTDVDPGAGVQWLTKIRKSSPKVKQRTGTLLEQVFMPCDMFCRYTQNKSETQDLKVKPLKELAFNSDNIIASMTSRQFQVINDAFNSLQARPPKHQKSKAAAEDDDEEIEEEGDEAVPDGVEEVDIERVNLEHKERAQNLLYDDIRKLAIPTDTAVDAVENEGDMWMVTAGRSILVQKLRKEVVNAQKARKAAAASLKVVLRKAAAERLMEKEKNKGPSCAMSVSFKLKKVAWSMLLDGKTISEIEINDMIYDFDRDYKDIGVARFTIKYCAIKNCLPNAKSDTLLAAWNPPSEWGKKVMIRVDAKLGAPKDGASPIELFQADVYPLKIHLTESMYRVIWGYFFPEEEQDSHRRQEVWKVSTTAGLRRGKKGNEVTKDLEGSSKSHTVDSSASKKGKATHELKRSSSFDKTWEESVAESVANELLEEMRSLEQEELSKPKSKDSKSAKSSKNSKASKTGQEEKKSGKQPSHDKKGKPEVLREFHNIKISQVELLVTYEGPRFAVSDLRLLMDSFHRVEFTGTWKKLFARVQKHVIWSVLKSVTGMQGKKFKDKSTHKEPNLANVPTLDQDSEGDDNLGLRRAADGAGDGFVTSVRGLFSGQRRKAKAFVLRTMRNEGEEPMPGEWSDNEDYSPFARQLTITKTKQLIKRHTKKFYSSKGFSLSSPKDDESDSSDGDPFEDYLEYKAAQEKATQETTAQENVHVEAQNKPENQ
ncbi:putative FMP27, GFWDK domain-containing protein [Helianthus annuus]|nr:putative FMP27, GFWDK domain-containing protein [Helianthus annuus]KAJ0686267.1 putative FMP27, GFWDK domain-containing protein [Helianthus annuus]KAJ0871573.1 putative FMP27, GFWDK domain-containing protein [Helianthus annuus]